MSRIEIGIAVVLIAVIGVLLHSRLGQPTTGQCYESAMGYTFKVVTVGEFSVGVCRVDEEGQCKPGAYSYDQWNFDYLGRRSRTDCAVLK